MTMQAAEPASKATTLRGLPLVDGDWGQTNRAEHAHPTINALPLKAYRVWMALVSITGPHGEDIGWTDLTALTPFDERTVRDCVDLLEEVPLIRRVRGKGGRYTDTNRFYLLNIPDKYPVGLRLRSHARREVVDVAPPEAGTITDGIPVTVTPPAPVIRPVTARFAAEFELVSSWQTPPVPEEFIKLLDEEQAAQARSLPPTNQWDYVDQECPVRLPPEPTRPTIWPLCALAAARRAGDDTTAAATELVLAFHEIVVGDFSGDVKLGELNLAEDLVEQCGAEKVWATLPVAVRLQAEFRMKQPPDKRSRYIPQRLTYMLQWLVSAGLPYRAPEKPPPN